VKAIAEFAELFLTDTPLIDTRAPVEFARGSFPSAINLPLMSDGERSAVGTCYKEQGSEAAVALGHELVSGRTKEQRISAWADFAQSHPAGALFCFRGGMRSQISQSWLSERGIDYSRIEGGYKAMRRWLLQQLERLCMERDFIVISGKTGSAKTRLINEGNHGKPFDGSLDLEGLANHRGSAFGRRVSPQPTQINFEHQLAVTLLKIERDHPGPVIIEDESRLIGRCALPAALKARLEQSPLVVLDAELDARVTHSFENYILANLSDLNEIAENGDAAFSSFSQALRDALARIRKRLGGLKYSQLSEQLENALAAHAKGDNTRHRQWIAQLLVSYYDPMYEYQLSQRSDRICFSGNAEQVSRYLRTSL